MLLDSQTTLGELARKHPAAPRVFHRHHLDYCCGGRRSLDEACREKGIDPAVVIAAIEERANDEPAVVDWAEAGAPALIEHILRRFHEPLRPELARLVQLAEKVERVHAEHPDRPSGLAALLHAVQVDVENHLAKEEQILFPMICAGAGRSVSMPIRIMLEEHDDHGRNLARLRNLASDFTPPADACGSWIALYSGRADFERDLMLHIHLENNVLFPLVLGQ
jgi:regulator of cell morphogenesis and NO signaling